MINPVSNLLEDYIDKLLDATEATPEFMRELLWHLNERISKAQAAARRVIVGTFASALLFELLNRNLIGEASAIGIKLANLELLKIFALVALAYLVFRRAMIQHEIDAQKAVYDHVMLRRFPGLFHSGVGELLTLGRSFVSYNDIPPPYLRWRDPVTAGLVVALIESAFIVFVPTIFTIYAYWQLLSHNGFGNALTWISLVLSLSLFIASLAISQLRVNMRNSTPHWMDPPQRSKR